MGKYNKLINDLALKSNIDTGTVKSIVEYVDTIGTVNDLKVAPGYTSYVWVYFKAKGYKGLILISISESSNMNIYLDYWSNLDSSFDFILLDSVDNLSNYADTKFRRIAC